MLVASLSASKSKEQIETSLNHDDSCKLWLYIRLLVKAYVERVNHSKQQILVLCELESHFLKVQSMAFEPIAH